MLIAMPSSAFKVQLNLVVLWLGWAAVFASYCALENLQSSLYVESTLGVLCVTVIYSCKALSSIKGAAIVRRLTAKWTLVIGFVCHLLYVLAHLYPCHNVLIPAAVIAGLATGPLWICLGLYINDCGHIYARLTGKKRRMVISQFNGWVNTCNPASYIIGNFASSTVLSFVGNSPSRFSSTVVGGNVTLTACGSEYCPISGNSTMWSHSETLLISNVQLYSLVAVLAVINVSGTLCAVVFLGNLEDCQVNTGVCLYCTTNQIVVKDDVDKYLCPAEAISVIIEHESKQPARDKDANNYCQIDKDDDMKDGSLINTPLDVTTRDSSSTFPCSKMYMNLWLLVPFIWYIYVSMSVIGGMFNKSYVTCYLGISMICYMSTVRGVFGVAANLVSGSLGKFCHRNVQFAVASVLLGLMAFILLQWGLVTRLIPSHILVFIVGSLSGIVNAIHLTHFGGLLAEQPFSEKKMDSFSFYHAAAGLGMAGGYAMSAMFCVRTQIYVIMMIFVGALVTYLPWYLCLSPKKEKPMSAGRSA